MIDLRVLKYLASQKRKDAEVLFRLKRNNGAIYLMGYALEFSFKRKVCQTLGFNNGFPESSSELNLYTLQIAQFNSISSTISLTQLRQIKNHDLNQLLIYSGAQTRIINSYLNEWLLVRNWSPENRYRIQRFTNEKTTSFMKASRLILKEIA
jgi:hypothetical protein